MFNLLKNKRPEIDEILTSVKPDIIIGTNIFHHPTILYLEKSQNTMLKIKAMGEYL
jgi:hypothetical protein